MKNREHGEEEKKRGGEMIKSSDDGTQCDQSLLQTQ
jgi:hypothetical protein